MSTLELKVYEIFKSKLGEIEASTVLEYFDAKTEKKYDEKKDFLATKEDINNLRLEVKEQKIELIRWVFAFFVTLALLIAGLYLK